MVELIEALQAYYVAQILIGLSVLLILVDYYFPTDVPCHFGYFCFAAAMFFVVPFGLFSSLLVAFITWLILAILHQLWFKRFLVNAHTVRADADSTPPAEIESGRDADAQ